MRAFVKGEEGGTIVIDKAADAALKVKVVNDDGSIVALSTATLDALIHDTPDRRNAPIHTLSITVDVAAHGAGTLTIAAASANFGPGTYYLFVRRSASAVITFANKYTTVNVA